MGEVSGPLIKPTMALGRQDQAPTAELKLEARVCVCPVLHGACRSVNSVGAVAGLSDLLGVENLDTLGGELKKNPSTWVRRG